MPTWRPRKRASAPRASRPISWPATRTVPVSGRSSPAITISSVDLPEPDGPTKPTASPRPISRAISLRICTRAAPRPSERLTPKSATAGAGLTEISFMRLLGPLRRRFDAAPIRHVGTYGKRTVPVQMIPRMRGPILAAALGCIAAAFPAAPLAAADRAVTIVALGDSLTAGFGLAAADSFPAKLLKALAAKGIAATIVNAGVSGDTASGGLARLAWSGSDDAEGGIVELGANDAPRGGAARGA